MRASTSFCIDVTSLTGVLLTLFHCFGVSRVTADSVCRFLVADMSCEIIIFHSSVTFQGMTLSYKINGAPVISSSGPHTAQIGPRGGNHTRTHAHTCVHTQTHTHTTSDTVCSTQSLFLHLSFMLADIFC